MTWAIRKINQDGSLAWMAAFAFQSIQKSIVVDDSENYVYIGVYTNPLDVLRISSTTGALIDAQR